MREMLCGKKSICLEKLEWFVLSLKEYIFIMIYSFMEADFGYK